ncbi:unnamed protein product [Lactuca saligna]|uniref:Fructose-1-6-bisphosphatase class I N-terminal domain-containing protein n=1 Tax=Lactuca saligna TaxID=75948 RepID=A0AA35ZHD8_LACSI|nr:unnamed protein product [Lactuca saligna]
MILPFWITDNALFVVVTDPFEGSRNIVASVPAETIFRIYNHLIKLDNLLTDEKELLNSLQSSNRLVDIVYVLYSSATILCTTFGSAHTPSLSIIPTETSLSHT